MLISSLPSSRILPQFSNYPNTIAGATTIAITLRRLPWSLPTPPHRSPPSNYEHLLSPKHRRFSLTTSWLTVTCI